MFPGPFRVSFRIQIRYLHDRIFFFSLNVAIRSKGIAPIRAFHIAPPLIMVVEWDFVISRRKDDCAGQDLLLCIQTNSQLDDPNRMKAYTPDHYLKSPAEMFQLFGTERPDSLRNTMEIAEKCNLELNFGRDPQSMGEGAEERAEKTKRMGERNHPVLSRRECLA